MTNENLKNYVDHINDHLLKALNVATQMQTEVQTAEGDSDLYRKLAFYLTPTLNHWIVGAQAGNMKDLKETLARRLAQQEIEVTQAHQGDGHEVLTKPST